MQLAEKCGRKVFLIGVINTEGVVVECCFINTSLKHLPKNSFSPYTPEMDIIKELARRGGVISCIND